MKRTGYKAGHNPLMGGSYNTTGFKIITRPALPELDAVPRGWIERLFTLPWHPLIASRLVLNKANVKANGIVYKDGNGWVMTDRVYESLKRQVRHGTPKIPVKPIRLAS